MRTSGLALSVSCSLGYSTMSHSTPPDMDREDLTLPIIVNFPGLPGVNLADRHAFLHLGLGWISYLGSRTHPPIG